MAITDISTGKSRLTTCSFPVESGDVSDVPKAMVGNIATNGATDLGIHDEGDLTGRSTRKLHKTKLGKGANVTATISARADSLPYTIDDSGLNETTLGNGGSVMTSRGTLGAEHVSTTAQAFRITTFR